MGLFSRKARDLEIPPPPPPILAQEPIPHPVGATKIEPPVHHEMPKVNIEDFAPKEPVFKAKPELPGFSQPMKVAPIKPVAPEQMGGILKDQMPMQELHHPEPIVPEKHEFKGIGPSLRKVEEKELAKQPPMPALDKPLYVKADDYKSIIGALTVIKTRIEDSEKILTDLNELKNTKDRSFEKWRSELEDIQRKLLYIDKTLYEGG